MALTKKYQYKVYGPDNSTFIEVIKSAEIKNNPSFRKITNGGLGQHMIDVNRTFGNLGWIVAGRFIRIYENDKNNTTPVLIFEGFISRFIPYLRGSNKGVEVFVLGVSSKLSRLKFTTGNQSGDPAVIFQTIIDHFAVDYPGMITTDLDSIGTSVSIDFDGETHLEAIKKTFDSTGGSHFWTLNESSVLKLKPIPTEATHEFVLNEDVDEFESINNFEDIINSVKVLYDGGSVTASDATSITANGERYRDYDEQDIKNVTTAQQFADQKIEDNKDKKINATLRINSNFNLETIKAGDSCKVVNIDGSDFFSENMLIVSISYNADFVNLELEENTSNFGIELEKFISS